MGLTGTQVLIRLEVPLAVRMIFTGIRTSLTQVVATATLAAVVGGGGLGRYVVDGYALQDTGQAAYDVHKNLHQGKVGVLCLAPEEGLGVRDDAMRERLLPQLMRFRDV